VVNASARSAIWCGGFNSGPIPNGNGCANRQSVSHSSDDHEQVQTARIDHNINTNNTAWFRFQADTGVQAAYTDPINPLFNSISPQPLYSFASGYAHVFSQNLVNYFNPAFSWYSSLFEPQDLQKTLAAFPIVLQGNGSNAPFTTIGGLDNTWLRGRRASRFFMNDNLSWSRGSHELRVGTNIRIFHLNDFDFGEGTVPVVTYTDLPQFIYGVASTAAKTFPRYPNEPFNFLNIDLYAQDTWKITKQLTWTIGVRGTFNSNPLSPHDEVARLRASFNAIAHDVNQPLSDAIQTHLANLFFSTPLAVLQPRTAIAWQVGPKTVFRSGFGLFSDLLPRDVADMMGMNPPYVQTFQGGLLGTVGGSAIAPECRTARSMRRSQPIKDLVRDSSRDSSRVLLPLLIPPPACSCHHCRAFWDAARGLLHAMELRRRAPNGDHCKGSGSIRRHSCRKSAVHDAGQRLSDRMPRLLHALSIPAADRSPFWSGHAVLDRGQQPLPRSAIDGDETP
jgi:hypothetical protein